MTATGQACRLVVAARLAQPELEFTVFRALQFAHFTSTALLDETAGLRAALQGVDGVDADRLIAALDSDAVEAAYQEDRGLARTAAGRPIEAQGRAADTDGAVRYTAPSVIFTTRDGASLEVGGFQPLEAYDTALANLDVTSSAARRPRIPSRSCARSPTRPSPGRFALCMTSNLGEVDDDAAERALIAAAGEGVVRREAIGDHARWH